MHNNNARSNFRGTRHRTYHSTEAIPKQYIPGAIPKQFLTERKPQGRKQQSKGSTRKQYTVQVVYE